MRMKILVLLFSLVAGTTAWATSFETQDANGDGSISKDEFYGYVTDAGIYPDYDLDGDGFVELKEFNEADAGWDYDAWDADSDSYVDTVEFYDGYFGAYDQNEDGHWDGNEWDDAGEAGLFDM